MTEKEKNRCSGRIVRDFSFGHSFDSVLMTNVEIETGADLLSEGLYFVFVSIEGYPEKKRGLVYVPHHTKKNKDNNLSVELHILDFRESIMGKYFDIFIQKRRRTTQNFESMEQLLSQVRQDILWARKYFLRLVMADAWANINDFQRLEMGKQVISFFEKNKYFRNAENVFIYAPRRDEINFVQNLCSRFKEKIYHFPRIKNDRMDFYASHFEDLKPGKFGILEPQGDRLKVPTHEDVLILPAVAIDQERNRLGKGAGYFDRYLQDKNVHTISVVPEFAFIHKIPTETHDIPVDDVCIVSVHSD